MKNRETALITGASAGIGAALARVFAAGGHDLILVARRSERLAELARELAKSKVAVRVWQEDLADPGAAQRLYERAKAEGVVVDILVNNAGFGLRGRFDEQPLDRLLAMIAVNVTAPTELTHRFLRDMRKRGTGRIVTIASMAGFQPGPFLAVYYATKGYDWLFTEALAEEAKGSGITVTCVYPGATATEWQAVANIDQARLGRLPRMSAKAVANAAYRGMMLGKRSVIPGLLNKAAAVAVRLLPRSLVIRTIARLQR